MRCLFGRVLGVPAQPVLQTFLPPKRNGDGNNYKQARTSRVLYLFIQQCLANCLHICFGNVSRIHHYLQKNISFVPSLVSFVAKNSAPSCCILLKVQGSDS